MDLLFKGFYMAKSYIERGFIGVVGGRMLVDILLRCGFGRIVALEKPAKCGNRDVDMKLENSSGSPELEVAAIPESIEDVKSLMRSVDLIIGCREQELASSVAEELGRPYISSGVVTAIMPDGIKYDELLMTEAPEDDAVMLGMMHAIQAGEAVKILSGNEVPVIAPYGIAINSKTYSTSIIRIPLKPR